MKNELLFNELLRGARLDRGWSQREAAEQLGVSHTEIRRWEHREAKPQPHHLQMLTKLYGKSLKELGLEVSLEKPNVDQEAVDDRVHIDKGELPHIDQFYGREIEQTTLKRWILNDRCRVMAIVGMGGIGKTSLAVTAMKQVENEFDYVFCRSLKNAPSPEQFLRDCLQFLSDRQETDLPEDDIDGQISLLVKYLHKYRCLIVLDNMEAVLQAGHSGGKYREGYKGYGTLLQRIGESDHQSCFILTSRDEPKEVAHLQGAAARVRVLPLIGVGQAAGRALIEDKGLFGSDDTWQRLIDFYAGNPLILRLIAESIATVDRGNVAKFLTEHNQGDAIFGDIRGVLEEQFQRLSPLEQEIMYWLAIERDAISEDHLQENLVPGVQRGEVRAALEALRRRSMVEADGTLLPVILEYVTDKLVEQMYEEIYTENIKMFVKCALIQAQAKEYIRNIQIRLILTPLTERLRIRCGKDRAKERLQHILSQLRETDPQERGYAAGNVLHLLAELGSELREYDFSHLKIRQAYLQGVELQGVNFAHADFEQSVFIDTFASILSVAFIHNGRELAAGTASGDIRLWQTADGALLRTYQGHKQWVFALAFNPKRDILASGSGDQTIRVWQASTGQCLYTLQGHDGWVRSVALSPDGNLLVSCSEDRTIRLWDISTEQWLCLRTLHGHDGLVRSVVFSPDGTTIASASEDGTLRLWNVTTGECFRILKDQTLGHNQGVWSVAFSSDGEILASGGEDKRICLWNVKTGQPIKALQGHADAVRPITFSPDGTKLASCSEDKTVCLWDVTTGKRLHILEGHSSWTRAVDFSPDGLILASGSEDQTVRLWDVSNGSRLKVWQGYTDRVRSIAFSPDGDKLVSCSENKTISLWDIKSANGGPYAILRGHSSRVRAVAFSPNGDIVASGSDDWTIRLWDVGPAQPLRVLSGHTNSVRSVAFSLNGKMIASASDDKTVRLWDIDDNTSRELYGHAKRVRAIAFNGNMVASGSEDTNVRLWDVTTRKSLRTLQGHDKRIWAVALSPDGKIVASGSEDTTVRLWDTTTGECIKILREHSKLVWAVAFSPDGKILASGSEDCTICLWQLTDTDWILLDQLQQAADQKVRSVVFSPDGNHFASASNDGTIKLWNMQTRKNPKEFRSKGPYKDMNITQVKGLTLAQRATLKLLGATEN